LLPCLTVERKKNNVKRSAQAAATRLSYRLAYLCADAFCIA
jgi:hypothetical protein